MLFSILLIMQGLPNFYEDPMIREARKAADQAAADADEKANAAQNAREERLETCRLSRYIEPGELYEIIEKKVSNNPSLGSPSIFMEICLAYMAGRADEVEKTVETLKKLETLSRP